MYGNLNIERAPLVDWKKYLRYMQEGQETTLDCLFLAMRPDAVLSVAGKTRHITYDYGSLADDPVEGNPDILDIMEFDEDDFVVVVIDF